MWAISVLGNAKSDRHRKTHWVESGGTARKYMFLLGEILPARAGKKSAEAILAMTPAEKQEERRAEESRKKSSLHLDTEGEQMTETRKSRNCGGYRSGRTGTGRWILSGKVVGSSSLPRLRTRAQEGSQ